MGQTATKTVEGDRQCVPNNAGGDCGLYGMSLHALRDGGMDARDAQAILSMDGASREAKVAMKKFLELCRKLRVEYATKTGQRFYPVDRPPKTDEELAKLAKSDAVMGSQRDWDLVTVMDGSYLDENAVMIIGKLFGLLGAQIVQEDSRTKRLFDAINAPEEELGAPRPLGEHLLLHHPGREHFEALLPEKSMSAPLVDPYGPGVQYLTEPLKMNFEALIGDAESDGETDGETDSDADAETPPGAVTEELPEVAADAETDGETDSDDASPNLVSDGKAKLRLGDWSDYQCPYWGQKRAEFDDVDDDDTPRDEPSSYAYDTGNMYVVLEMDEEDGPDEPREHDAPGGSVDEEDDATADDAPQEHDEPRGSVDERGERADSSQEHVGAPQDAPSVDEEDEWMPRVRVTKPRSWRRTGRRQLKHNNRRLREKRRRNRRQRRGAGGLRRRAPIRGGANPGDGQVAMHDGGKEASRVLNEHSGSREAWLGMTGAQPKDPASKSLSASRPTLAAVEPFRACGGFCPCTQKRGGRTAHGKEGRPARRKKITTDDAGQGQERPERSRKRGRDEDEDDEGSSAGSSLGARPGASRLGNRRTGTGGTPGVTVSMEYSFALVERAVDYARFVVFAQLRCRECFRWCSHQPALESSLSWISPCLPGHEHLGARDVGNALPSTLRVQIPGRFFRNHELHELSCLVVDELHMIGDRGSWKECWKASRTDTRARSRSLKLRNPEQFVVLFSDNYPQWRSVCLQSYCTPTWPSGAGATLVSSLFLPCRVSVERKLSCSSISFFRNKSSFCRAS